MDKALKTKIETCYFNWSGQMPTSITPLAQSGSNRLYFRIENENQSVLAAYNSDLLENKAFLGFTQHFAQQGANVPKVYYVHKDQTIYLLQDLGNETLLQKRMVYKEANVLPSSIIDLYKKSLAGLAQLQTAMSKDLDFSLCISRPVFDRQAIYWDLNYFKYYFLKVKGVLFNEQHLEDDFNTLSQYLAGADAQYFMFRDFQARNIMCHNNEAFFIDYQGGRKGALQYDVASLLFQAKANLPFDLREELASYYLSEVKKYISISDQDFWDYYYGFVWIRCIQVLGAYGFRGLIEGKKHFLESIPFALKNIKWLLENTNIPISMPTIKKAFNDLIQINDNE